MKGIAWISFYAALILAGLWIWSAPASAQHRHGYGHGGYRSHGGYHHNRYRGYYAPRYYGNYYARPRYFYPELCIRSFATPYGLQYIRVC